MGTSKTRENDPELNELIGKSKIIKDMKGIIAKASQVDYPVLIFGETGVGKTLVARLIHLQSNRRNNTFIHQSCSNLPEALFESELFGYEKGSFTGAIERKIGKIEKANGGTLFLDGISDLTLQSQAKLLLFLESGKFFRLGGDKEIKIDVKIISASNKELKEEIKRRRFRNDLYYRINTIEIYIPPLIERKQDIPLLVENIVKNENRKTGSNKKIRQEAIIKLMEYNYPGNVRELENIVKRAYATSGDEIEDIDIFCSENLSNKRIKFGITPEQIKQSIKNRKGNKTKAAEELGISRRHLYRLLEKFDMSRF